MCRSCTTKRRIHVLNIGIAAVFEPGQFCFMDSFRLLIQRSSVYLHILVGLHLFFRSTMGGKVLWSHVRSTFDAWGDYYGEFSVVQILHRCRNKFYNTFLANVCWTSWICAIIWSDFIWRMDAVRLHIGCLHLICFNKSIELVYKVFTKWTSDCTDIIN